MKIITLIISLILAPYFMMAQENVTNKPQVIAHRGYWDAEKSAQNSLTALKMAQEIDIYGSELDINLTKDGELIVCHGPKEGDIQNVQYANFSDILKVSLKNGEKVPTLKQYLKLGKKDKKTILILELKPHDNAAIENEVVKKTIKLVKKYRMQKQVEFISFSFHMCKELSKLMKDSKIAYLGGDLSPKQIKEAGLTGIDYKITVFDKNPNWVKEAQDLGLTVNVWTVSKKEDLMKVIDMGVDYITTNDPLLAKQLCR